MSQVSIGHGCGFVIASYPGHMGGGRSGLVSTVCACAKNSMIFMGCRILHESAFCYHAFMAVQMCVEDMEKLA